MRSLFKGFGITKGVMEGSRLSLRRSDTSFWSKKTMTLCAQGAGLYMLSKGVTYNGEAEVKEDLPNDEDPYWRSVNKQKPVHKYDKYLQDKSKGDRDVVPYKIFSGNANRELAQEIADHLDTKLGEITVGRFSDGEVSVHVHENVRGKEVFVIQPTCNPVNENIVELLLMVSCIRRASARRITAVIPYYGYSRQERKMGSRTPIAAADIAKLLETVGVDRVIAVDLHFNQIKGFFGPRVMVENLEGGSVGVNYYSKSISKGEFSNLCVLSPDANGVHRAQKFLEALKAKTGVRDINFAMITKHRTPTGQRKTYDVIGKVEGSDVIIVDDMIDTAGTLCEAVNEVKRRGANRVLGFATHGVFSGPAVYRILNSPIEEVIVTNTIPLDQKDIDNSGAKIKQLSVSVIVAEAIRRIQQKESLTELHWAYQSGPEDQQ